MSNQKLSKYEQKERSLGTQFLQAFSDKINQAAFTPPNSYSVYDGWYSKFEAPDSSIAFEIKVRNFDVDKYNDYIIEAGKLKNLLKLTTTHKEVLYMNFFLNEKGTYDLIVFNLSKRIPDWKQNGFKKEVRWMNSATFRSTTKKVEKEVIMLEYDERYDTKITNTVWQ